MPIVPSARSIAARLAANGTTAEINSFVDQATNLGDAITVVTTDSTDTMLAISCPSNTTPLNWRAIWTDFGGGNETDSIGWNYNSLGEKPNEWGMAQVLETPFDNGGGDLMEYWWSMQAPTASAFDTWRAMIFAVTQATSYSDMVWSFDKTRWFGNPNISANPNEQFTIDTENERIFTTDVAFGVGQAARVDANGPMFYVSGSSGTGLEFVRINPTTIPEGTSVLYITPPSGMSNLEGINVTGSCAGILGNVLRTTHATGMALFTIWATGGMASQRWLTTNGDWSAGSHGGDSGAWKLAASYLLDTNTALRVDKTTFAVAEFGPHKFEDYTVGTAPSAASFNGHYIDVTDEAGGPILARSNGTNWKRISDQTNISS